MSSGFGALCVFCGSSFGGPPVYREGARAFGAELARRGIDLVWGGGHVGLMGVVADAVLDGGRRAVGVIPEFMVQRELAHPRASELVVVDSMHTRKATMAARADGFVLLPGGLGSFEEFFEVVTWAQLELHQKPIGILNLARFFDPLLELLRHASREGFIRPDNLELVVSSDDSGVLIDRLSARQRELAESVASGRWAKEALDKS
jgi:uncharacterized protein (TIGR00730 family)